jgi:type IV pilus biogenesis protein CpaD/CtpE
MTNITRIKTGGRKTGTPNKTTSEVRAIAKAHAGDAIELIVSLMNNSENDAIKLQAAKELLDRCYGKTVDHAQMVRYEVSAAVMERDKGKTFDQIMHESFHGLV